MGANTTLKSPVHLVQRLRRLSSPVESPWPSSVADHFDLDYMGSAEFEFGALATSKKALRALHPESWGDPKRIAAPSGQDAWFVGPPERVMLAEQLLAAGLSGAYGHHTEERLCIFEACLSGCHTMAARASGFPTSQSDPGMTRSVKPRSHAASFGLTRARVPRPARYGPGGARANVGLRSG